MSRSKEEYTEEDHIDRIDARNTALRSLYPHLRGIIVNITAETDRTLSIEPIEKYIKLLINYSKSFISVRFHKTKMNIFIPTHIPDNNTDRIVEIRNIIQSNLGQIQNEPKMYKNSSCPEFKIDIKNTRYINELGELLIQVINLY